MVRDEKIFFFQWERLPFLGKASDVVVEMISELLEALNPGKTV